jgi:hypothetical protein
MIKNREVFQRDPAVAKLLNDGVAAVNEAATDKEILTLRYELEHFVCEGQYKDGLVRILESFTDNINSTSQRAAWVSGFFGSGKSHLLKMFRHLWVNTIFDSDRASARGIVNIPTEIKDLFLALDTLGRRHGGLHAAAGTLPSGGGESVRLAIVSIILKSKALPESLPQAQFCLWLQKNGMYEKVKLSVEQSGKVFMNELHDMYVSPTLAKALLEVDPAFAPDLKAARAAIRLQFPVVEDISTTDFVRIIREVLNKDGVIPCTVVVLDEMQLYIGDSAKRSTDVQEAAEALCKQFDSRILLVGAGQTALAGNVPLLQRLSGRFTIPVELSDADVETVTRRVVLAKKADKRKAIEEMLLTHSGEIDRQLAGTKISKRSEDSGIIVDDYPLLPVRRRFWEHVLRAVDPHGTNSQLRTQLKIVYDAVRETADAPLGTIIPADLIFEQLQPDLLRTSVLLRELDENIRNLDDGTPDGRMARRLCGLIFLIRKLPREPVADIGVRATPDILADLLVTDLVNDGLELRKDIPRILEKLVESGKLIKVDEEYSLQTRESNEWDREFRNKQSRLNSDMTLLARKRNELINSATSDALARLRLTHGKSKEPRRITIHFGSETPETKGREIPVWIRDGWGEKDSTVLSDARAAGSDSPTVFVFIPKSSATDLQKTIVDAEAAQSTIEIKGAPSTAEGREARDAMATRLSNAIANRDELVREVINSAKVFQGGGNERYELSLEEKTRAAAQASLERMFPNFQDADDERWHSVINKAKNGDESALVTVDWKDSSEKNPVCSAILTGIGPGKRGKEIRDCFENSPYGWPRDAIDAALIVLFTAGHVKATYKGSVLTPKELDQAKIPMADFRKETLTIDTRSRIKLRKLFQSANLSCKPNEEIIAAGQFLAVLGNIAGLAGGDAPLPARPSTQYITDLQGLSGNELLGAILEKHDLLENDYRKWSALKELADQRTAEWAQLQAFIKHGRQIPAASDYIVQADAVANDRRLLQEIDPLQPIKSGLATVLREALVLSHTSFADMYKKEMSTLAQNETWKKLDAKQKSDILRSEGISEIPTLNVRDNEELLSALNAAPIGSWKTRTDALPHQFTNASIAAAKLLEPKVQNIKMASATIRNEADLDAWLTESRKKILSHLKDGPVMLS